MFTNYLKLSFRSLLKNPLFSALNLLGLSFGLTVALLLFLQVRQELAFDRYHSKADRIFRVVVNSFWDPARPSQLANAPNVIAPVLKERVPAVEQSARILQHEFGASAFVTAGSNKLVEERFFWADPSLVEIFDIPTLAGNMKEALSQPNCIALSKSTAVRYFGTSNPVGQTLLVDRMDPLVVKAVYEDFPTASSLDANALGSFITMKWANQRLVWSNSSFETWLLLNSDASAAQVQNQLAQLYDENVPKEDQRMSYQLQALKDVHLHSSAMDSNHSVRLGDPKEVSILATLALAVLIIACFNYMNLSTARSQLRFKEVGINKTMGASKRQLSIRFFAETGLITSFSMIVALGMVIMAIPYFNRLTGKELHINMLTEGVTLLSLFGITLLVVLFAGAYPAFFLSSFQPKNLLQPSFRAGTGGGWFRRSLITTQFAASVILIIGTLVLYKQMAFIRDKKLGFEPEQVVAITTIAANSKDQIAGLIQGCRSLSQVKAVCRAQSYPGLETSVRTISRNAQDQNGAEILTNRVTPGFEQALDLKLIAGTTLPEKIAGDTIVNVVLTQKAVEYLGLTPETVLGKKIECNLGENSYVSGVVENFHAESLHKPVGAYAFHDAETETRRFLLVKMQTTDLAGTMAKIEGVFKNSLPQSAFEYRFLDDQLEKLYQNDQKTAKTMLVFSLLSILVSCLGLFGLAAFAAEQRVKEIGIRRVLGASVMSITGLLSRDFLKL
ncbi:MAG: ABC transporter permease, partial [Saprospiraceae bacterium]|nr:ABC transporter permease [Saprospiraceae bacterium]